MEKTDCEGGVGFYFCVFVTEAVEEDLEKWGRGWGYGGAHCTDTLCNDTDRGISLIRFTSASEFVKLFLEDFPEFGEGFA